MCWKTPYVVPEHDIFLPGPRRLPVALLPVSRPSIACTCTVPGETIDAIRFPEDLKRAELKLARTERMVSSWGDDVRAAPRKNFDFAPVYARAKALKTSTKLQRCFQRIASVPEASKIVARIGPTVQMPRLADGDVTQRATVVGPVLIGRLNAIDSQSRKSCRRG